MPVRRERLIRPTKACRFNILQNNVGLIRRASVASGAECRIVTGICHLAVMFAWTMTAVMIMRAFLWWRGGGGGPCGCQRLPAIHNVVSTSRGRASDRHPSKATIITIAYL